MTDVTTAPAPALLPLLRQAQALAAEKDWPGICALLSAPPHGQPKPRLILLAIQAALATDDAGVLAWAVHKAIACELPHKVRSSIALQLVSAGKALPAYLVLTADPATTLDLEARRQVSAVLSAIVEQRGADPLLRTAAGALLRGVLGEVEALPEPARFDVPGGSLAVRRFPLTYRLAPGVHPSFTAQVDRLLAMDEREADSDSTHGAVARVDVIKDVYVNRDGNIWRPDGRLVGAQPLALPPAAAPAMAVAPRMTQAELVTGATRNFYHWFGAWLPGMAWRLSADAPSALPVLLRDDAPGFQAESLRIAFGPGITLVPIGDAVHVQTLYRGRRDTRYDAAGPYEPMLARFIDAAQGHAPPGGEAELLYISRRDSRMRTMANEAELERRLIELGFSVVTMSGRPLVEQISIVRAARIVVAPHGAGLSLLLFARPGTRVFEIIPAMLRTLSVRMCMTRISAQRGHRHLAWFEPCNEITGQWACSIPHMLPALRDFLADD